MLRAVANPAAGGQPGSFTTLTVSGTSTLGVTRVSTADSATPQFGVIGTTKGMRVLTTSSGTAIDGVDNTLLATFQPLFLRGSTVSLSSGGTEILAASITGVGITGVLGVTSYISGVEQTAPAAPAANGYRIFAQDNGAGKTQLMVIFASGAAQQLAIEP